MISAEHLSKRIDQYLNKSGTNDQFKISLPDKVRAINSAQIVLVKRKVGLNNVYKMGFESFRKRFDDLDFLIQKEVEMNITKSNNNLVVSTTLLPDYMFYINSYCTADKGDCKNRKIYNILVPNNDVQNYMKDSNFRSSFDWQEQLLTMSTDNLVLHKADDYTLNKLYIDYLRLPREVDIIGYKKRLANSQVVNSKTIDCEFPPHLEDELLDIIVEQLAMTITDNAQVQYSQSRQQRNE